MRLPALLSPVTFLTLFRSVFSLLPEQGNAPERTDSTERLPAIAATGSPPLANGLPAPTAGLQDLPCVLDPSTERFNILGSDFLPLVIQSGNKLQPLAAPKPQAEADALGPADKFVPPEFYFEKPAGASADIYDIVHAGSTPQYLAKTSQGDLVFTSLSSGAMAVERDGQTVITTIFGVDCEGHITVTQDDSPYTWDRSADGSTTEFIAGAPTQNKGMIAYPFQRARAPKIRRRNMYTEGSAPRCPNSPPNTVAKVFPGAPGSNPDGCGPTNGIDVVPDFSFGSCCDHHDNCYGDCSGSTFESCNDEFHACMRDECGHLDHWYQYILRFTCLRAADFYYWAVSTDVGRKTFYRANNERCACYPPEADSLCGRADGGHN